MRKLKNIWESKEISTWTKVKLYEALVLSVVLYNSETWTSTNENVQRLKVFEMACLCRLACVSRRQHIRSIEIKEQLGVITDLQHRLQIKRLKYFGHVERMGQERHPHIARHGRMDGVRSRGRPRRRYFVPFLTSRTV